MYLPYHDLNLFTILTSTAETPPMCICDRMSLRGPGSYVTLAETQSYLNLGFGPL